MQHLNFDIYIFRLSYGGCLDFAHDSPANVWESQKIGDASRRSRLAWSLAKNCCSYDGHAKWWALIQAVSKYLVNANYLAWQLGAAIQTGPYSQEKGAIIRARCKQRIPLQKEDLNFQWDFGLPNISNHLCFVSLSKNSVHWFQGEPS